MQRTSSQNWLSQQPAWTSSFSATAWFRTVGPKQLHNQNLLQKRVSTRRSLQTRTLTRRALQQPACATKTSARQLHKNQLEQENLTETSFEALCLNSFSGTACKEELPTRPASSTTAFQQKLPTGQLFSQQPSATGLQSRNLSASSWTTGLSDRQPSRPQLDRNNLRATTAWQRQLSAQKPQEEPP